MTIFGRVVSQAVYRHKSSGQFHGFMTMDRDLLNWWRHRKTVQISVL